MSTASELVTVPKIENKSLKSDVNEEERFEKSKLELKNNINNVKGNENGLFGEAKK